MAIYESLSIEHGGGILHDIQRAEENESPVICIGLGGTGADGIQMLKRRIRSCLKPEHRMVRYLVIDSDRECRKLMGKDAEKEFFDISKAFPNVTEDMDWLSQKDLHLELMGRGACGVRQAGRFLLFHHAQALRDKLTSLIQEAIWGELWEGGDRCSIYVFSGLTGGTGGGIFIDVCYILQRIFETLKIRKRVRLHGCFFMPDVNLSRFIDMDSSQTSWMKANAYAALKELDYLMNLKKNGGRFVQGYGSFRIDTEMPPADVCYLISADPDMCMKGGYEYGLNTAVEQVAASLLKTSPAGNAGPAAPPSKQQGAFTGFHVLSSASLRVPLAESTTYLGAGLFEKFGEISGQMPSEEDLAAFAARTETTFSQLINKLMTGVIGQSPNIQEHIETGEIFREENQEAWINCVHATLEANLERMIMPLTTYDLYQPQPSVISCIFSRLCLDYAEDRSKGPFFAQKLLCGQGNMNMLQTVEEYIVQNRGYLHMKVYQEDRYREELAAAKEGLAKAGLLNRARRRNDCLNAWTCWYRNMAEAEGHRYMERLLIQLRDQIRRLDQEFFLPLTRILSTAQQTCSHNRYLLSQIALAGRRDDYILDLSDFKDKLDYAVDSLDADQVFKNFMKEMREQHSKWSSQDEHKIARLVSDFVIQQFGPVAWWTIGDILVMKYQAADYCTLKNRIREDMMEGTLKSRSAPRLWLDSKSNKDQVSESSYLLVPAGIPQLLEAAGEFGAQEGISVYETEPDGCIALVRCFSGIPLYAYRRLAEMKKEYDMDPQRKGIHLYEGEALNWREVLPPLIPVGSHASEPSLLISIGGDFAFW